MNQKEIQLSEISSDGFGIVVDWMYSGQLPNRAKEYSKNNPRLWSFTLDAYQAADMLMIDKLQNELISNEAAVFMKHNLAWQYSRLQTVSERGLCHIKHYNFVLKSVVKTMMSELEKSPEEWMEQMRSVENNPRVLFDLLRCVREWQQSPWKFFPRGDLTEFLIPDLPTSPSEQAKD